MKRVFAVALVMSMSFAHANEITAVGAVGTILPTALVAGTTQALVQSVAGTVAITAVSSMSPFLGARSVADLEQMRDEVPALQIDMDAKEVSEVEEVRQNSVRELFSEISADDATMETLRSEFQGLTDLEILTVSLALTLQ